jgi:hypothetical protein
MKWIGRRESSNVNDRRGMSGGQMAIGGGIGGLVLYIIINLFFGGDVASNINDLQNQEQTTEQSGAQSTSDAGGDEMAKFASVVLADNEDVWNKIFSEMGKNYSEPTMVLFTNQTQSSCGFASSATGPFYCPSDQQIYLDLDFFNELKNRFGAEGDFANAYVIAHEVGHHVQHLLGTTTKVQNARQKLSEKEGNKLSVALELQADFYAGVWAHYNQQMKHVMEEGDLEEALNAASAIGDDRLQKMSTGTVAPDAFTHGTSAQRREWFKKGFESGDLSLGNTFN